MQYSEYHAQGSTQHNVFSIGLREHGKQVRHVLSFSLNPTCELSAQDCHVLGFKSHGTQNKRCNVWLTETEVICASFQHAHSRSSQTWESSALGSLLLKRWARAGIQCVKHTSFFFSRSVGPKLQLSSRQRLSSKNSTTCLLEARFLVGLSP